VSNSPLAALYPSVNWETMFKKTGELANRNRGSDWSASVAGIKAPTLLVFADADAIRPKQRPGRTCAHSGTSARRWSASGVVRVEGGRLVHQRDERDNRFAFKPSWSKDLRHPARKRPASPCRRCVRRDGDRQLLWMRDRELSGRVMTSEAAAAHPVGPRWWPPVAS
jgi:hypothetical protein